MLRVLSSTFLVAVCVLKVSEYQNTLIRMMFLMFNDLVQKQLSGHCLFRLWHLKDVFPCVFP